MASWKRPHPRAHIPGCSLHQDVRLDDCPGLGTLRPVNTPPARHSPAAAQSWHNRVATSQTRRGFGLAHTEPPKPLGRCYDSNNTYGGNVWESNPPTEVLARRAGFEDQWGHQTPSAPDSLDSRGVRPDHLSAMNRRREICRNLRRSARHLGAESGQRLLQFFPTILSLGCGPGCRGSPVERHKCDQCRQSTSHGPIPPTHACCSTTDTRFSLFSR